MKSEKMNKMKIPTEIEIRGKEKTEMLELRNTITTLKKFTEELNSRLDQGKQRISVF